MITYEYQCPACGVIELTHSIMDPARTRCPTCDRPIVRLCSGGIGFIMDPDCLWDTPPGEAKERKIDLKKSEAGLLGVPLHEREFYRKVHYGKIDGQTGRPKPSKLTGRVVRSV